MDTTNAEFRRHSRRLFAVLRAIVRRSADSASGKVDFAARIESRIGALGRVHEMIMRSPREGVDFEELLHGELVAQAIPSVRYSVAGPDTRISGEAAIPLGLALHELAVNSVIHGAFAGPRGSLEVSWLHTAHHGHDWLAVTWQESFPEMSSTASQKGFGLELIERSLPYELDAKTRVALAGAGARIELEIPARLKGMSWVRGDRTPAP